VVAGDQCVTNLVAHDLPVQPNRRHLDERHRILVDYSYLRCGYNLRGLEATGACPECGALIGLSLRGDRLSFAAPGWIATVAGGMNWIVASICISIGIWLLNLAGTPMNPFTSNYGWTDLIEILPEVTGVIGFWRLSTPEPGSTGQVSFFSARKLLRVGHAGSLLISVVQLAVAYYSSVAVFWTGITVILLSAVGFFASLTYARRLALRVPDYRLAHATRLLMWGCAAIFVVGPALLWILAKGLQGMAMPVVFPAGCALVLAGLLIYIWALMLVFLYRRQLSYAARLARDNWVGADDR